MTERCECEECVVRRAYMLEYNRKRRAALRARGRNARGQRFLVDASDTRRQPRT